MSGARMRRLGSGLLALGIGWLPSAVRAQEAQPTGGLTAPISGPAELDAESMKVLDEVEKDFARYAKAADDQQDRIASILRFEYEDRKNQLEKRYSERIAAAETEERQRRLAAIALLEKFIQDYPDHKKFTPDAMFRLADLYLDQANEDFEEADIFATAAGTDEEAPMRADYSKSIAMWREIATRFPDYRQKPGVLYLLAYYQNEIGKTREALQVARGLVCSNKYDPMAEPEPAPDREVVRAILGGTDKPPYVDIYADCQPLTDDIELSEDTWARIVGDIHFTTAGELQPAIAAYSRVAGNKDSKFYDEALYKLAWSYYRNDDFIKGIDAFDKSIVHYDKELAEGKEPIDLRGESLQYIAISFTDPWSLDEQPDPVRSFDRTWDFYKDRMGEDHVRDVWIQMGDTFVLLEAYTQAADSYRLALKHWPLHPDNPVIHQKIVNAYVELGDSDLADEEAAKLATNYRPGTEWYKANETNREAMENQRRIGEQMLRAAAENTHRAAQLARQEWVADPTPERKEKYMSLYLKAAALYEQFLTENPTAEESYEFTYRLGEVNFFAERYDDAITHYRWVRDHRHLSEQRFEKSARSIVQAYQLKLDLAVEQKRVAEPPIPSIDDLRAMPKPIQALAVPKEFADLRTALDEYQQLVNDPQSAPQMGYQAALISFRHLQLDDAEIRFKATLDRFCGTDEAANVKDALLAIYEARGEDDKFKATNDAFISSKCGSDADISLAKALNRSKEFRQAEDMFRDKKYPEAAIAFYRYYKTVPPDDPNRPVALYNSAIAYERSGKPKTAVFLFKEFTENQDPMFKDSEYYLPALYLTAVAYYKAFDYDSAVGVYLDVVRAAGDKNRKPPAGDRSLEEMRLDALYNAAVLRELDRVYKDPSSAPGTGAASLYTRYAKIEPDRRKSDRAMWAVARIWREAQDLGKLETAYNDWRKTYGRDAGNADDYVFSYYDLAKQNEKKGKKRDTIKYKKETIDAWSRVGKPKRSAASDMAAEFEFEQAEDYYNAKFAPYKIKSAPKTKKEADAVLNKLDQLSNDTKQKYLDLGKYESGTWGLAALVRVGDVLYFQALKIAEIPTPKDIIKLDDKFPDKNILVQYEDAIAALVKPLEEAARPQWEKVVSTGKQQGVANEWTQLALERLHDFVSQDQYPVQRNALAEGTEQP